MPNAPEPAYIPDYSVESKHLRAGSVTSAKIKDGTIATADIADGAVTSAKILDGTIATGDIADGAVTSAKILDGTITAADLAAALLALVEAGNLDVGTLSLATEMFLLQYKDLKLTGSERLSLAGTTEVVLSDFGRYSSSVILGSPKVAAQSFTIPTDYWLDQIGRLTLVNQVRATLQGSADLILTDDLKTRNRIVLAGGPT